MQQAALGLERSFCAAKVGFKVNMQDATMDSMDSHLCVVQLCFFTTNSFSSIFVQCGSWTSGTSSWKRDISVDWLQHKQQSQLIQLIWRLSLSLVASPRGVIWEDFKLFTKLLFVGGVGWGMAWKHCMWQRPLSVSWSFESCHVVWACDSWQWIVT